MSIAQVQTSDRPRLQPPKSTQAIRRKRRKRRGAAFLLLVLMILLVVAGTTSALVQGEVTSRWSEREQLQDSILSNSIAATAETLSQADGESIELVMD
ncbi:MAG: hypothetical protein ACR2NZ_25380, partial [Rubripirellula sp.]